MKSKLALFLAVVMIAGVFGGCSSSKVGTSSASAKSSSSDTSTGTAKYAIPQGKFVIGLSNSYYGNTWRKQMVDSFSQVANDAKAKGYISSYVVQNGDGTVNAQIAQINSFILQGVSAICIDAASGTALNSVIDKAVAAGIPVIAFDSGLNDANAYCMDFDFISFGVQCGTKMADAIGDKGNVVIVRGVAGSVAEGQIYDGYMQVIKKNPGLKVISTVQSKADATVAQEEFAKIIPSLGHVDAIFNDGGDTWGIIQAYEQAGTKVPLMAGDNSSEFLSWWTKQSDYNTTSMRAAPACGTAAFWAALDIVNKVDVPKKMKMALSTVSKDQAKDYANLLAGEIAGANWTNDQVMDQIITPSKNS